MDANSVRADVRWLTRSLGWNPLRRRLDRVVAVAVLGLLAAAVLMVPAAIVAGNANYAKETHEAAVATVTRRPVEAVVTGAPEAHVTGGPQRLHSVAYTAEVSWTGANGDLRVNTTAVPSTTVLGSKISLWVDRADQITIAPPSDSQLRASAVAFALGVMVAGQVLCAGLIWGVQRIADACAARAWTHDWNNVEPKWLEH